MKLYGGGLSPYVQRVRYGVALKGHRLPQAELPADGLKGAAFLVLNPLGRIPVLELDDGWTLAESGPILHFLDDHLAGPRLLAADPRERARARWIETLAEVELGSGVQMLLRSRLVGRDGAMPVAAIRSPAVSELALNQVNRALQAIARLANDGTGPVASDAFSVADAMLYPLLALLKAVAPYNDYRDRIRFPSAIAGYRDRLGSTPAGARVSTQMAAALALWRDRWGLEEQPTMEPGQPSAAR